MAGRQSRLHLIADKPGTYAGQNQQFSGRGYSDMHFKVIATSRAEFQAWLEGARQSPDKLDWARYGALEKPSVGQPVTYFSWVEPGLFDDIIRKYKPIGGGSPGLATGESVSGGSAAGVSEGN
jgi:cytochrome o ubiquinol oxidase subunit 2